MFSSWQEIQRLKCEQNCTTSQRVGISSFLRAPAVEGSDPRPWVPSPLGLRSCRSVPYLVRSCLKFSNVAEPSGHQKLATSHSGGQEGCSKTEDWRVEGHPGEKGPQQERPVLRGATLHLCASGALCMGILWACSVLHIDDSTSFIVPYTDPRTSKAFADWSTKRAQSLQRTQLHRQGLSNDCLQVCRCGIETPGRVRRAGTR